MNKMNKMNKNNTINYKLKIKKRKIKIIKYSCNHLALQRTIIGIIIINHNKKSNNQIIKLRIYKIKNPIRMKIK